MDTTLNGGLFSLKVQTSKTGVLPVIGWLVWFCKPAVPLQYLHFTYTISHLHYVAPTLFCKQSQITYLPHHKLFGICSLIYDLRLSAHTHTSIDGRCKTVCTHASIDRMCKAVSMSCQFAGRFRRVVSSQDNFT